MWQRGFFKIYTFKEAHNFSLHLSLHLIQDLYGLALFFLQLDLK